MKADRLSIKMIKDALEKKQSGAFENYDIQKIQHVKRESILQAAITVFRKKGYNDTTITDIVTEAGVGRNTFYIHFKKTDR